MSFNAKDAKDAMERKGNRDVGTKAELRSVAMIDATEMRTANSTQLPIDF
jgi:hypothetical protein